LVNTVVIGSIGAGIVALAIVSILALNTESTQLETISVDQTIPTQDGVMVTNGVKHLVPLDKIKGGGPPKDGIPSIDDPKFVSAIDETSVSDEDFVIGVNINGESKAYPLSIMVWHEIVNDYVGGVPVSVTYCPLCFTNQVFERIIDNQVVEFGTSGKLYNSNLVMYDRLTDSQWSQALGIAIVGEMTGYELQRVPFDVIEWKDWKSIHPDTLVLTTDTGYIRAYGVDPYGDYYTTPGILFPVENRDDRLHPKEIIIGLENDGIYKAYVQADIESTTIINDKINGQAILLTSQFTGNARVFDRVIGDKILEFKFVDEKLIDVETNSEWNYEGLSVAGELEGTQLTRLPSDPGFWFEWIAFHPSSELYVS